MTVTASAPVDSEEDRIRDAYARRRPGARDSFFTPGHLFMVQERERRVLELLVREGIDRLEDKQILEVGCGRGNWLRDLVKWGARPENITAVDLRPDGLAEARRTCAPGIVFVCTSAANLNMPDASFDVVLQSTMFTSILDAGMREAVAAAMLRVLRPGGLILWYDYHVNNPANPDVRGVKRAEIERLFPGCDVKLDRVTLAPPVARMIAPFSRTACRLLEIVPLFRTHYLGVIRKRSR